MVMSWLWQLHSASAEGRAALLQAGNLSRMDTGLCWPPGMNTDHGVAAVSCTLPASLKKTSIQGEKMRLCTRAPLAQEPGLGNSVLVQGNFSCSSLDLPVCWLCSKEDILPLLQSTDGAAAALPPGNELVRNSQYSPSPSACNSFVWEIPAASCCCLAG